MDITDNHFHLDPNGQKEEAVKSFLKAGGTRLVLVHKPYSPWNKIEEFKSSKIAKDIQEAFPDAKLIDVSINKNGEKND